MCQKVWPHVLRHPIPCAGKGVSQRWFVSTHLETSDFLRMLAREPDRGEN